VKNLRGRGVQLTRESFEVEEETIRGVDEAESVIQRGSPTTCVAVHVVVGDQEAANQL
jgi:hypothetical protein